MAIFNSYVKLPEGILFISYPFMVCSRWQRTTKLDKDPSGPSHGLFLWAQLSDSVHQNSYLSMVKQNCITHYTFLWHPQPTFLGLKSKNLFCLQDFKVKKHVFLEQLENFVFQISTRNLPAISHSLPAFSRNRKPCWTNTGYFCKNMFFFFFFWQPPQNRFCGWRL